MVAVSAGVSDLDLDNLAADAIIAIEGAASEYGSIGTRVLLECIERQNAVIVALVEAVKELRAGGERLKHDIRSLGRIERQNGSLGMSAECKHPPERLWAWYALDCRVPGGQVLCVACCDCGTVLQGGDNGQEVDDGD